MSELEYSLHDTRIINECNWQRVKRLWPNKQYHCYNYVGNDIPWQFEDTGYKWHELFGELFEPSEELVTTIDNLNMPKEYISVQLRFVNALERFENTFFDNYLETKEERDALIRKCKEGINDIVNEHPYIPVYVFSDSKVFLDSLSDLNVNVLNHDSIGHSGTSAGCGAQMKTFIDLFVMSKSKIVYRIKAKELYNLSCFALLGARIGNVTFIDKDLH